MNFLAHLVLAEEALRRPQFAAFDKEASTSDGTPSRGSRAAASEADVWGLAAGPQVLVGSLLPDLTRDLPGFRDVRVRRDGVTHWRRGERLAALPAGVRAGAEHHRAVDRATDRHPAFLATRARLTPEFERFAGVVADVLFDHALSVRWDASRATSETGAFRLDRGAFIARVYTALTGDEARDVMPGPMRHTIDAMVRHDWLNRYATAEGVERTLLELSVRFTRRYGQSVALAGVAAHLEQHGDALLADFDRLWGTLTELDMPDTQGYAGG